MPVEICGVRAGSHAPRCRGKSPNWVCILLNNHARKNHKWGPIPVDAVRMNYCHPTDLARGIAAVAPVAPVARPASKCGHHRRGEDCDGHGPLGDKPQVKPRAPRVLRIREDVVPFVVPDIALPVPVLAQILTPETRAAAKNHRNIANLTFLGSGIHRAAYQINGTQLVVKFGTSDDGRDANLKEVKAFAAMGPDARSVFCPIYAADPEGKFVIMPKVEKAGRPATPEITRKLKEHGLSVFDINYHNCGLFEGRMVIYDYGFGVEGKAVE